MEVRMPKIKFTLKLLEHMQGKAFTKSIASRINYWRNTKSMVDHLAKERDTDMRFATEMDKDLLSYAMTSMKLEQGSEELKTLKRLSMFKFYQCYEEMLKLYKDISPPKTEKKVKVRYTTLRFHDFH